MEENERYIALRQYGTAFMDAFGMLPLTYFGAVGDNKTDNYANIQVAINESIKKGLKYIFVPEGTYFYTGTLLDLDKVTFLGNSDYAKIYDGENEIKIYQISCQMPYQRGGETLSKEASEAGYIDIEVPVKNGVEAILLLGMEHVLYVVDGLVLLDGKIFALDIVPLDIVPLTADDSDSVYLHNVELLPHKIRIHYGVMNGGGLIDKKVVWRVR